MNVNVKKLKKSAGVTMTLLRQSFAVSGLFAGTSAKRVLRGFQLLRTLNFVGPDKYKIASDGLRNRGAPTGAYQAPTFPPTEFKFCYR